VELGNEPIVAQRSSMLDLVSPSNVFPPHSTVSGISQMVGAQGHMQKGSPLMLGDASANVGRRDQTFRRNNPQN
jgi:hypothetical protein